MSIIESRVAAQPQRRSEQILSKLIADVENLKRSQVEHSARLAPAVSLGGLAVVRARRSTIGEAIILEAWRLGSEHPATVIATLL